MSFCNSSPTALTAKLASVTVLAVPGPRATPDRPLVVAPAAGGRDRQPVTAPAAGRQDRQFVTALARGLELLRCFGPGDRWLGNQELARRTRLPKPTVSRLAHTLTRLGYLRHSRAHEQYALGTAVLSLGYTLLAQLDVRRVARPLMQSLAEHAGVSVNLGVRDRLGMVYLDTYRSAAASAVQLEAGSRLPLAVTSMGRAYLCGLPEPERRALLEELRLEAGKGWPEVKRGIDRALRDHQRHGLCFSLGDWRPEVHAVAVPLVPAGEGELLVFSASGAAFQVGREKLEREIGPRLKNLVDNVRSALTYG
jgi:DNA-binding IclR family transcriptional regulator